MPVYQYACPDCGYKFELKQKFTDNPTKACPHCGRLHVYRVVGPVAVTFKGSGWYITDSRSSSDKKTIEHKHKETPSANGNGAAEGTSTTAGSTNGTSGTEKAESKTTESTAKADVEKPKKA